MFHCYLAQDQICILQIIALLLIFVRDGIYNSVADYNSTWRVSSVCVSVCVSRGKLRSWITFERFELEG